MRKFPFQMNVLSKIIKDFNDIHTQLPTKRIQLNSKYTNAFKINEIFLYENLDKNHPIYKHKKLTDLNKIENKMTKKISST